MLLKIKVNTDGGARGNPGPGAIGYVIRFRKRNQDGSETDQIFKAGKYIGFTTNNQAEYEAVIEALRKLKEILESEKYSKAEVLFLLDSQLVVNQLNGLFKIKVPDLRNKLLKIRELENETGCTFLYRYIPREQNAEADNLVNDTLDAHI